MSGWAIDLGNSHTRVARWDSGQGGPRLLELPAICRRPGEEEPLVAPRLIPSATDVVEHPDPQARIGRWPFIAQRWFLGRLAYIGRQALERSAALGRATFVPNFKLYLDREATRPLARAGGRAYTARDVARLFMRELLAEIERETGERIRDVVLTAPVDAYETYRAELSRIAGGLGIRRTRFVDEPVAAALGYGLGLDKTRVVLVVDFGAGNSHLALVGFSARETEAGRAEVLAKVGRLLGGNDVNRLVLSELCRRLEYPLDESGDDDEAAFWQRLMLAEACRVKEAVYFNPTATFHATPPAYLRRAPVLARDAKPWVEFTRADLEGLLERHGVYRLIGECLEEVLKEGAARGVREEDIEDVLMVGGSTLLPRVYPFFEERFGRDRVRAWQPFEAGVFGACAFAAGQLSHADFIVHDYAFVTYDAKTQEKEYTVVVPRGTRFPTPPDFWKRQFVPTCALGEPEALFKLVICEIGRGVDGDRRFVWDRAGQVHKVEHGSGRSDAVVVPLNEANPALGYLEPPHPPSDRRPRLEIAFGVNAERWLCATVQDLRTRRVLMQEAPVVRLL